MLHFNDDSSYFPNIGIYLTQLKTYRKLTEVLLNFVKRIESTNELIFQVKICISPYGCRNYRKS